jgi:hypothetical protein
MKNISFRASDELVSALDELAARQGCARSSLLRQIIEHYLAAQQCAYAEPHHRPPPDVPTSTETQAHPEASAVPLDAEPIEIEPEVITEEMTFIEFCTVHEINEAELLHYCDAEQISPIKAILQHYVDWQWDENTQRFWR